MNYKLPNFNKQYSEIANEQKNNTVKRYPVITAKNQSTADADDFLMRMIAVININTIGPMRENGIPRQT